MFETRNQMLNVMGMMSGMFIFLDADAAVGQDDLANHNKVYIGFEYGESAVLQGFGGFMINYYDDEED